MDTHVLKVVGWNPSTIYFSHLFVVKIVISVRKRLKINKKGWPIFKNNKMGRGSGQGGQSAPRFEPKIILSLN